MTDDYWTKLSSDTDEIERWNLGSTPASERGALVERFQSGTAPVFLISLQAGGTPGPLVEPGL